MTMARGLERVSGSRRARGRAKQPVLRVAPASNAARLGFREGDQILAYDGANTTTEDDFRNGLELANGERPREIRIVLRAMNPCSGKSSKR